MASSPPAAVRRAAGAGNRGAKARNRTVDTRIFSPLLYQLSYLGRRRNFSKAPCRAVLLGRTRAGMAASGSSSRSLCPAPSHHRPLRNGGRWAVRGSNPRRRRCKRRALPAELTARFRHKATVDLKSVQSASWSVRSLDPPFSLCTPRAARYRGSRHRVPRMGLEPIRGLVTPLGPQPSASASSATSARRKSIPFDRAFPKTSSETEWVAWSAQGAPER